MYIVELALKRPHTFIVLAIAIALFGTLSILRMPIDIFPDIDIPVVSCVYTYTGMVPYQMENLVTTVTERALTSTINGISRMESVSLSGMSIIKIYLVKGTDIGQSVAMVTSVGTAILRTLPRGISPPFVTASSATDVPVLQLGLSSNVLTEAQLFDIANNFVRSQLATVQGTIIPFPYGGKYRQVMVDLDTNHLTSYGLSAYDIEQAVKAQNVINPTGTIKMGPYEYIAVLNDIPETINELNNVPIKTENGNTIFLRDVAQAHDGYQPQLNIVNENGHRGILFNILKAGNASTLTVVDNVKKLLPRLRTIVPAECNIKVLTDQSTFVRECVGEVVREAVIAAALTALMMLALLGSWRSTLIVATSIPLAMLASIICLNITGQTINSMTLGGLALAVGMLVDDATVAIENLHSNLAMGKDIVQAILDGAEQVALPALVSTLSICIVFVPVLFLTEPARSLFVPLGMAVVFAMLASYGLSRTIVPLMSKYLLAGEAHGQKPQTASSSATDVTVANIFSKIHVVIENTFDGAREHYSNALSWVLDNPLPGALLFLGFYALSFCLVPAIGADFFPAIDAGQLRLHIVAIPGTRVEETERLFKRIERAMQTIIPKDEMELVIDNIGLPPSGINYAYSDSQTISEADGEIQITLTDKRSHSTAYYQKAIRNLLTQQFPECSYYFQPADIVTQILNAGLPAPIDIKVFGYQRKTNYELAQKIRRLVTKVPGAVDVSLHQVVDAPNYNWEVDRIRANQVGITQKDVSNSFLISLSSSFQNFPNFWLNRQNGVSYNLAAQTPQWQFSNIDELRAMPITASSPTEHPEASPQAQKDMAQTQLKPQLLTNLATATRMPSEACASHINVQPVYDIYVSCQGRDLGGVSSDVRKIINEIKKHLTRGSTVVMAAEALSMIMAFAGLIGGLAFALVLVYLLLVVNFQSWSDPLIILMAIPGAFSGIAWALFVTQTTFSIPALMGTIMTVGVASANSILMVTFANDERNGGRDAKQAALKAGFDRFRPVIMTATAMVIGMIPMAIGQGQGGSQNAPIGRAVIGGLTVATFSTLLFVPLIYSILRGWQDRRSAR